jgi:diguanylate cyclase (GGDEF)-like protein
MVQLPDDIVTRLKTCTSFQSPPPVAMKVIELAQNPEIDLVTVADTISGDPAIAAKVMRIANSALYARRRQSSNLRQALIVLGLNATLTLALSFSLVASLRNAPPKGFDFDAYWRRAILAGTWGKLLAGEFGRRDAEEVFLAALLQDIGMLAVDKIAPEVYEGISPFQLEHARVAQHEKTQMETDHRMIGAWLLNSWNMPEHLCQAVLHSHDLSAAGVDNDQKGFIRAVAMSGDLADVWIGSRNEVAIRRAGMDAHRNLGILPNRLAEMFEIISDQLPVAESIFEMDLFETDHLQDFTDTAREILIVRNLHTLSQNQGLEDQKRELEADREELQHEASSDGLTGVFNRRYFEEALAREFNSADNHNWPVSIVFVDLDRFKQINATHGHQAGDKMLCAVADLLTENLRSEDILARYGGDEFVLLLPGLDAKAAEQVAGRLVDGARGRSVKGASGDQVSITLSLGTATQDSAAKFEKPADLLAAADEALYHSKRNGRDQHTCYDTIKAA